MVGTSGESRGGQGRGGEERGRQGRAGLGEGRCQNPGMGRPLRPTKLLLVPLSWLRMALVLRG